MVSRRRTLALVGAAALSGVGGCASLVTGEPIEVVAEPARGSETVSRETGYELKELSEEAVEEEFSVFGRSVQIQAANWVATHEKTISHSVIGEANLGVFAVLTSPSVEVAGQEINPVGGYDNDELVSLLDDEYEDVVIDDEVTETLLQEVLGEETEISVFEGEARFDDTTLDVYVHVGAVRHADDYVIPMAIYPQELSAERDHVARLTRSVVHPVAP